MGTISGSVEAGSRAKAGRVLLVAAVALLLVALALPVGGAPAQAAARAGLRVEPEHARDGYDRDLFNHWVDADGDGCDARDEVLIVESVTTVTVTQPGCVISGGRWVSVYDGVETTDASSFDIDHMVPLAEAWDSGAWAWDATRREQFANDLTNDATLIAVSASSNRSKGDSDPAEWQPPSAAATCEYVTWWVQVKTTWDLTADPAEATALDDMLEGCDTSALPPGGTFIDDNGSVHEPMIEAIAAEGITGGCTTAGNLYCPTNPVSRAQMATFLARALHLPAATTDHFSDDDGNPHEDNINRVADAGIAGGTGPGTYSPAGPVSRAQMGTFLARASNLDPVTSGPFSDIAGNVHAEYINAIAQAGITAGCNPQGTRYCPSDPVSRGQMATLLGRALGLTPMPPPPPPTTTTAPPTTTTVAKPANPGDSKNCGDFATWSEAQGWHDRYFTYYGDVANLDSDGDGIACESLPGAP